jgi:hypothetical protein
MTPIDYFSDVWQRCGQIQALHAHLAGHLTAGMSADELLRGEWVARGSALDLYVHEIVAQNMVKIFAGLRNSGSGFSKFSCSMDTVLRIRNAMTPTDAAAAFDLEVRSQLSRKTFQFPENIAEGIRLVSGIELWNEIAVAKGATAASKSALAKNLKRELSLIVERRNKIAHEGDLQPSIPRIPWPITGADVSYVAQFIEDLVLTIDNIV